MTDPYAPQPDVPQGYLPPAAAYLQPLPDGHDPNDPLVNPPGVGVGGWFTRIGWMFKRSWKSIAAIFAITHLLPSVGFAVIGVVAGLGLTGVFLKEPGEPVPGLAGHNIPLVVAAVLGFAILFFIMQSVGYAAATYAVTREAAGHQVPLGEALAYGFRRCLGLTGWQVLTFLAVMAGLLACILPAFYVIAATALVGPVYLFERQRPMGRSFTIFNQNLGRVLGRLALILAATLVAGAFTSVFDAVGKEIVGFTGEMSLLIGAAVVSSLLSIIIELPVTMLTFSGILLTYTEQRGHEGPVNSRTLAAEL